MNGINNNISNSNYNFENNNNSNSNKDEESFFDKVLDSISGLFSDEDEKQASNVDKSYMMKLHSSNTYTLTPMKNQETLSEKWDRENETVELKQKQKEIAKLQQNINALKSKNKLLEQQNEMMQSSRQSVVEPAQSSKVNDVTSTQVAQNTSLNENVKEVDKTLPTHTSIPKSILEKQQNEISEVESSTKVESPKKEVEEAKLSAAPQTITEQYKEEAKA